jgi:hypothetical protein
VDEVIVSVSVLTAFKMTDDVDSRRLWVTAVLGALMLLELVV